MCAHVKLGMGVVKEKKKSLHLLPEMWNNGNEAAPSSFSKVVEGIQNWTGPVVFDEHSVLNPLGFFSFHLLQSCTQNVMPKNIIKEI